MATNTNANIGFEKQIWDAACVLRGNMDASEYKSVVLGLIFLKYISDRFEAKYNALVEEGDGSDIEGLLAYGQWEGVLLYPTENHIAAGSQVEVTKPDGREVIFFTTGETLSYSTHKETVLTRKCPF